ncbi:MAG: hypothetical protein N4A47_07660 [Clostridia bacterium]|jgi:hypothetical protein|nr:hypothetical protein [Clostridia bacterium]
MCFDEMIYEEEENKNIELNEVQIEEIEKMASSTFGVINRFLGVTKVLEIKIPEVKEALKWTNPREYNRRIQKNIDVLSSYDRKILIENEDQEKGIEAKYEYVNEMDVALRLTGVSKAFLLGYTDNPLENLTDESILEIIENETLRRKKVKGLRQFYGISTKDVAEQIFHDESKIDFKNYQNYEKHLEMSEALYNKFTERVPKHTDLKTDISLETA